ncbi:hypothetical protein AALJ34_16835 [Paraclostridium bifermentans]|uniref:hypothetical protein n=1 Tax=Paraclostridium bifermentans TaxID=1490 RepID=UPI001C127F3A|nr:hypothetical protein [Paraclostridium bifermentans]MBU5288296.1 hypothetical protein [Paraclostridium bifermentans]
MIVEDELLKIIEQEALYGFKVDFDLDIESFFLLRIDTIDELIRFAKVNNINSIFYDYFYFDKDVYLIDLDQADYVLDESIYKLIKEEIIKYNEKVEKINFEIPRAVAIFVLYQGRKIGLIHTDNWIEKEDILEADEQLEYWEQKHEHIIEDKRLKEEKQLNDLKIEFEDYLLNDRKFFNCTNQTLRKHYAKSVFDNETAKNYKSIFMKSTRYGSTLLDNTSLLIFIEMVWKKYKSNMYKYKNNVID